MNSHQPKTLCAVTVAGVLAVAAIGCTSRGGVLGVDQCADIPAGSIPQPAGNHVCQWQTAQVTGAAADQTILYQADFIASSSTLSPGAIARLSRNVNSGLATVQPTIIEPSGDAAIDQSRLNSTSTQLSALGIATPTVYLATPAALGLRGPQAERVAGGFGNIRNSSTGSGAPISRPSGLGGQGIGSGLPGGIF